MKESKDILQLEGIDRYPNELDTDFRAEALAAGWIEAGYDDEKIHLIRQGGFRRGFSKDIQEIRIHFSEYDLTDYLQIQTNRDSIYDTLPEGIFHQPAHKRFNSNRDDVLDEIRQHRLEEFYARKFFQVFEMESDFALVLAYLFEAQYDKKISNSHYTDIFIPYWSFLNLLNPEQRLLFMHSVPFLHQIRNNNEEIEKIMSALLEVPVKIEEIKLPAKQADRFFESAVNESRLGVDLVLGKVFDDGQHDLKITVGPVSAKKMEYFLEPSAGSTILDGLCRLFFPSDVFVVKDFKVVPEDAAFILSQGGVHTFLGINTFI